MRPIVTDRVAWSVCQSVTLVSPAKTAEPIQVPFALKTRVGPDAMGRENFEGEGASHCKV